MNNDAREHARRHVDAIEAFYDGRPYPPPVTHLGRNRQLGDGGARQRADYHLLWPTTAYREDEDILVAGCGTVQAARYATSHGKANVTGIDVSSTSLRHAAGLKRTHKLTNLELCLLPVERVHELDRSFDRVVCTGVLHHLPDPQAGLAALRSVLKPDGAMHLMVYAPYGRTGIQILQAYCRLLGIGTSDDEIRELAAALTALPRHHPAAHMLGESLDLRSLNGLADALLNPRERAYTVPELLALLECGGLTFGRWYRQAPYLAQCGALATTPHAARLTCLPAPAQYAAIELFRGTFSRHSVIAYRSDRPGGAPSIDFEHDLWRNLVPIRRPHALSIETHSPPGAAAVLLNRSHTSRDLVLPINAAEKRLLDAVDGKGDIASILRKTGSEHDRGLTDEHARAFFERLWWYDQVVFDASMAIPRRPSG